MPDDTANLIALVVQMTYDEADIGSLIAIIGVKKWPLRGTVACKVETGDSVSRIEQGRKKAS